MPTTQTHKYILHFALAGIAYFFVAHVMFNLVDLFLLKVIDAPVRFDPTGTRMYCSEMAEYEKTHGWLSAFWMKHRWLFYVPGYPLCGMLLYRVASRNIKDRKNFLMWLGILMIGTPLFQYAQGVIVEMSHFVSFPDHTFKITFQQVLILIFAITVSLIAYIQLFSRRERRSLWLVSLPALVITYFTWFYIMHRWVYKY